MQRVKRTTFCSATFVPAYHIATLKSIQQTMFPNPDFVEQ